MATDPELQSAATHHGYVATDAMNEAKHYGSLPALVRSLDQRRRQAGAMVRLVVRRGIRAIG